MILCKDLSESLIVAESHLRSTGNAAYSPIDFVSRYTAVEAAVIPNVKLRLAEVVPGLKLRSGSSIITVVRVIPTNKEVVYQTSSGKQERMPTEKFLHLATQQGYRKVWDVKGFLISLKALLKPVLDSVSLMLVMKWVLEKVRGKQPRERPHA